MTAAAQQAIWEEVPAGFDAGGVLRLVHSDKVNANYLLLLKELSHFSDQELSDFLHINVKTYRTYRDSDKVLRKDIQEHILMLLSLLKHGIDVFGNSDQFNSWIETPNPFFDMKAPSAFLYTISGIKLIDDRLTGIEYGDNV